MSRPDGRLVRVPRPNQLLALDLGDTPESWEALGFETRHGTVRLGNTAIRLTGRGGGVLGWAIEGVDSPIDDLPATGAVDPPAGPPPRHPNGIDRIDHVVVSSADHDRTLRAFEGAGLEARRTRRTGPADAPMRQTFLWAGDVIVELVAPDAPGHGPAGFFGLALATPDLDATAAAIGGALGAPKPAVQPGRRIARLRGSGTPIVVMSHHQRS